MGPELCVGPVIVSRDTEPVWPCCTRIAVVLLPLFQSKLKRLQLAVSTLKDGRDRWRPMVVSDVCDLDSVVVGVKFRPPIEFVWRASVLV